MGEPAVRVDGLVKRYGATTALADVSLRVEAGSVCAVLGRNGAGKTTAVRILTTLAAPTRARPTSRVTTCCASRGEFGLGSG